MAELGIPAAPVDVLRDAYGIPHIYGKTRYDVAFGAGWATARRRSPSCSARA